MRLKRQWYETEPTLLVQAIEAMELHRPHREERAGGWQINQLSFHY